MTTIGEQVAQAKRILSQHGLHPDPTGCLICEALQVLGQPAVADDGLRTALTALRREKAKVMQRNADDHPHTVILVSDLDAVLAAHPAPQTVDDDRASIPPPSQRHLGHIRHLRELLHKPSGEMTDADWSVIVGHPLRSVPVKHLDAILDFFATPTDWSAVACQPPGGFGREGATVSAPPVTVTDAEAAENKVIETVLAIHQSEPVTNRCTECRTAYPCRTAQAIGVTQ